MAEGKLLPISFYRLTEAAYMPVKKTPGAAGYDLKSPIETYIPPGKTLTLFTNLLILIPVGHCGKIYGKSGLACFHAVDVLAGVVDSDYRGDVGVILRNLEDNIPFYITRGMEIAQIVIEPVVPVVFQEIIDPKGFLLEAVTLRGRGGFGSTTGSTATY